MKRIVHIACLLFVLVVLVLPAKAVETIVVGEVMSELTGAPIEGVNIHFKGTKIGTSTDATGTGSPNTAGMVNINTAGVEELMTLSGIGKKRAEDIIAYREMNGPFSSTEELMNVSGIGQGLFGKLSGQVTVS